MNFRSLIQSQWLILVLLFLVSILFITNYTPGAFLTGWDNLQTELNPTLAIKRSVFASWQEHQSFGLPSGMAHAADIVRAIFMWGISPFLPLHVERFFFHMLMVFVGGVGMYTFLRFVGFSGRKSVFALLGGVFYILNLNIIQMMFLPFEPFSVFFAMLPWEVWIFLKILHSKQTTKRNWCIFFVIMVLATPQAVTQQIFVVLFVVLGLLTLGTFLTERSFLVVKKAIIALTVIALINSFWILPQLYFLKTASSVVKTAKINQLATEDVFFSNKDKGNIKDFLKNEGFIYERFDMEQKPLFDAWKTHREKIPITILVYTISALSLLGIVVTSRYRFHFMLLYLLIMIGLLSSTFPFDATNTLIRKSDFANQIFRSPFTKFAIPYAFVATYFFVCASSFLAEKLGYNKMIAVTLGGLLVIQALPAFQGNFVSQTIRVVIPQQYFQVMEFFRNTDKNKRIALLPEYTHWGWFQHTWGYDGSGFLWYGIEQPIVARTFDVWSPQSEMYYWEAKAALENEDVLAYERLLDKYNIDYLIYDQSMRPLVSTIRAIQYDRINDMLLKSTKITPEKKFNSISIYHVDHDNTSKKFISVKNSLPNIGPSARLITNDTAYQMYGDYITDSNIPFLFYYPFLNLTTQARDEKKEWSLLESEDQWILQRVIPKGLENYTLSSPTGTVDINFYNGEDISRFTLPYNARLQNDALRVQFPKIRIKQFRPQKGIITPCGNSPKEKIFNEKKGETLIIGSRDGGLACVSFDEPFMEQRYGYIIKVKTKNLEGRRLFFYIADKTKDQPYSEERLVDNIEYFIIGSRFQHGIGYTLTFQNQSYKTISSTNTIEDLSIYLLPYDVLKQFVLIQPQENLQIVKPKSNFETKKLYYYTYVANLDSQEIPRYIVLHQAYQEGWKAYKMESGKWKVENGLPFLFGKELTNHVLVNNWENGWVLDDLTKSNENARIVLVYLPQYLEYIGFGLLGGMLLIPCVIILKKKVTGRSLTARGQLLEARC